MKGEKRHVREQKEQIIERIKDIISNVVTSKIKDE